MQNRNQPIRLLEPGAIGTMSLKNRIVLPPMGTNFATEDGYVTPRMIDYYEARSRGGAGLIIVETVCIDFPIGKAVVREPSIDNDRFIPGLLQLSKAIKQHGAMAAVQLHHAGKEAVPIPGGPPPVSASAIPSYSPFKATSGSSVVAPRELTVAEIRDIVLKFAQAARRAREAGFDGVEVHGGTAYIVASFLSAAANQRQDAYGGRLENRARFLLEIIQAIRETVGRDYPVWCRLNALEVGITNGITVEETVHVSKMAQEAGADAIDVTAFGIPTPPYLPSMVQRPGALLRLAQVVRNAVTVPVMAGTKASPEVSEDALREGAADFIYMGRSLIADPDLPNKVATGTMDDIRPCLYCDECIGADLRGDSLQCSVNAAVGREQAHISTPATQAKSVMIVGSGPAGMEAARVARLRGHEVTLYDKEPGLGGQLNLAMKPPHKARLQTLIEYYENQLTKLGVKVKTETEVSLALIENTRPDVVVAATGARPFIPQIPGVESHNPVTAQDVLSERIQTGHRVVIIGGEQVGCETAEYLADQGKQVTIARRGNELATAMPVHLRPLLLLRLKDKGVCILTGVKYEQINSIGLVVTNTNGQRKLIETDTIVLAAGGRPNNELLSQLKDRAPEIYAIGDCSKPRRILEAIADGSRVGRLI